MSKTTRTLCEGAVCVALSIALSYVKVDVGAQGGSLNFTMIPLLVFAIHSGGLGWGLLAGFAFGTLKFFLGLGNDSINVWSMMLDYSVAYGIVGLAGLFKGKLGTAGYVLGTLVGCVARFAVHFLSGVTIYAEYAENVYIGVNTPNAVIYSIIYNGFYMLFCTIAALVLVPILGAALKRANITGQDKSTEKITE